MRTALHQFAAIADAYKAKRSLNFPAQYIPRSKYSDATANDLTRAVIDCFYYHGHFCTRLASTGIFRADLKKFVPSQQISGLPDVVAIVNGRAVFVEIKIGTDRLSIVQKETIQALEKAAALVFIAKDFASFWQWFHDQFTPFDEGEALPFGPVERESTPEIPTLF